MLTILSRYRESPSLHENGIVWYNTLLERDHLRSLSRSVLLLKHGVYANFA